MREIIRRIEREVGVPNLSKILVERIKPTDLQSLLLEVYQKRVKRRNPCATLSDYTSNRIFLPSQCDPALLLKWDSIAFSHLPKDFSSLELSPVCPIGSVSLLAPISQDWVLTTIRNMEIVADPTNILALECARLRQELTHTDPTNMTPVHLACSHRVVRTQQYRNARAFRLFSLCSAGRNTGTLRFETYALPMHIQFYLESLKDFLGPSVPLRVNIIDLSPDSHNEAVLDIPIKNLKEEFKDVDINLEKAQATRIEYYRNLRFKVYATPTKGHELELADGGDTDWMQKLLNNAKERLIISGIGSERLCEKFVPVKHPRHQQQL